MVILKNFGKQSKSQKKKNKNLKDSRKGRRAQFIIARNYLLRLCTVPYFFVRSSYNIKTGKETILRIWITIIRHGGSGHEVQESRPYLSNATPWPYELSHVKNEFSLVGLTACQYENGQSERESVQKQQWFRFNVSFVDCASVFVKSILETSLSFNYIL